MSRNIKALIIQPKFGSDLGDIIQIAKTEGPKLFFRCDNVKVLEVVHSQYGEIAVVQNSEVVGNK